MVKRLEEACFGFKFIFWLLPCEFRETTFLSVPQFPTLRRDNNGFVLHEFVKRIKLRDMGPETEEALNKCC